MAVSPPFNIAETLPGLSDLVSQYPPVENTYRDVVESWLTFISDPATGALRVTSTDTGATVGPVLPLMRDSASPAANDLIGQIALRGRDSAANVEDYITITGRIDDPTSGSEDASLIFSVVNAGVQSEVFALLGIGTSQFYTLNNGAAVGPLVNLFRDSASPAVSDNLGALTFQGRDSAAGVHNYGRIFSLISDPTNGSEDAWLLLQTSVNGGLANSLALRENGAAFGGGLARLFNELNTDALFIAGGSGPQIGAHIELYGGAHALASNAFYDAAVHTFRTQAGGVGGGLLVDINGFLSLKDTGGTSVIGANSGALLFRPFGVSNGANQMVYDTAGNFTAAGNVTAFSDRRLKSDIRELKETGKIIDGIQGKRFEKDGKPGVGFIAQDVQVYLPELVHETIGTEEDEQYLSLAYGNMLAVAWNEVRSLRYRVAELERR